MQAIIRAQPLYEYYKMMPLNSSSFMTVPAHLCIDTHAPVYVSEDGQFSVCVSVCLQKYIYLTLEDKDLSSCGGFSMGTAQMYRGAFTSMGSLSLPICMSEHNHPKSTGLYAESLQQTSPL